MCPKTMVSSRDSQTSPEVVYDSPKGGLPTQGGPEGGNASHHGNTDDEKDLGCVRQCINP